MLEGASRAGVYVLAALVLGVVALAGHAGAAPIRDIVVEDNSKTTSDTVILIAGVEVGDEFTPDLIGRVRADLVGSGLFRDVEVSYMPVPGGYRVIISARDKHSWVIAPTYYNQPTNKGFGAGFGENNLFGENKKLLLYGQYATGDTFFVGAYVDPSIRHTRFRWQADMYLLSGRMIEYGLPAGYLDEPREVRTSELIYYNFGLRAGLSLFRGAGIDARLRGARVRYSDVALAPGASPEDVGAPPGSAPGEVPAPGREGNDVSVELLMQYDRRANWYGIRHGDRYRIELGRALTALGSDFDYWYGTLRFERARRYHQRHNLIIKSVVGYGRDLPFQQELTAGGTGLRGFKNNQFRGDFKVAASVEYSVPLLSVYGVALRGVGFFDSSYVAFLNADLDSGVRSYLPGTGSLGLAPFKNTVGVGTRVFMRQVVLPLLGLDVGYGLERNDVEIYLAIGLTDM